MKYVLGIILSFLLPFSVSAKSIITSTSTTVGASGRWKINASQIALPSHQNINLQNGLVGFWDFSAARMGTTSAYDSTSNVNTGWLVNGAVKSVGRLGQGATLDGTTGFFKTTNSANFNVNTGSVSFWFYQNTPTLQYLYDLRGPDDTLHPTIFTDTSQQLNFYVGGNLAVLSAPYSLKKWHHVVSTYDFTNDRYILYLDGKIEGVSTAAAGPSPVLQQLYVGARFSNNTLMSGKIDEVRIYDRVLNTNEAVALYRAGLGAKQGSSQISVPSIPTVDLQSGLTGFWDFSAARMGTTSVFDITPNENTGWLNRGVKRAPGVVGQGVEFDGATTYINASSSSLVTTGNVSVSVWIKTKKATQYAVSKYRATGSTGGYVLLIDTGKAAFFVQNGSGAFQQWTSTNRVDDGKWHHIVAFRNGAKLTGMYVDGLFTGSRTHNTGALADVSCSLMCPLHIGASSNVSHWVSGLIDEVRIYNRVLNAQEVLALYRWGR